MISYNDLYESLRKEKYSEQLQVLQKGFAEEVAEYLKEKKKLGDKEEDLFSDITIQNKKKLENAVGIFKELMLRRRKKIINLAFVASETGISKKDFENMLEFERELFEDIVKSLEKSDKNLTISMEGERKENAHKLIRFIENVSGFLDLNGNEIGPFAKGEIANMEKELVVILEKDKRVEVLED